MPVFSMGRGRAVALGTACALLFALLTSCGPLDSEGTSGEGTLQPTLTATPLLTATPVPTLPVPAEFHQAPALDAAVQSGALQDVASRLPTLPKVVPVTEQIGTYGGTWHMLLQSAADDAQFIRTVAYEPLVRWTTDWSGIEPNLAEWYEVNENSTEYTFRLRRGLRWSDGEPFTTKDIRFWYEDVLQNTELTPVLPSWLRSRGEAARFEFLDDVTFKVYFSYPNSLFLQQLAAPDALMITSFPEHYARQFHAKYVEEEQLKKQLAKGGYTSWADRFVDLVGRNSTDHGNFVDPDRPRMSAWVLKTPYTSGRTEVLWSRNAYYWKVDSAGNQLPYIDAVVFQIVDNLDEAANHVIAGEVDMQNISALGMDASILQRASAVQDIAPYSLIDGSNNVMVIHFNMAHKDATKREIFRNKNFRIGLSYAINRQELLDFLYGGDGIPWQAAPRKESPFYDPVMAEMYTEYSPEKADQYLDSAGFKKDHAGNRLGPDGLPISFSIEVLENQPRQIAMLNMIAKYWADVGIDVQPKVSQLPLYLATVRSNLHDAAASTGGATFFSDVLLNPSNYVASSENAYWAVTWANWFNDVPGYENVQPPDQPARKAYEMYDRIRSVSDIAIQMNFMKNALIVSRESFVTIGIALGPERFGIRQKNFKNVPAQMPEAWLYPDPAPTNPEQYFISAAP